MRHPESAEDDIEKRLKEFRTLCVFIDSHAPTVTLGTGYGDDAGEAYHAAMMDFMSRPHGDCDYKVYTFRAASDPALLSLVRALQAQVQCAKGSEHVAIRTSLENSRLHSQAMRERDAAENELRLARAVVEAADKLSRREAGALWHDVDCALAAYHAAARKG